MSKSPKSLPMPPPPTRGPVSLAEWRDYRIRRRRHLAAVLQYDRWWRRPPTEVSEKVFGQLVAAGFPVGAITPPITKHLSELEQAELRQTLAAAATLLMGVFLTAGRDRMPVTINRVFDALAFGWSDHFRVMAEPGIADCVRSMTPETIRGARRDLLRWGIDVLDFWRAFSRTWSNPYFSATVATHRGDGHPVTLCSVELHEAGVRLLDLYRSTLGHEATRPQWSVLLAEGRAPEIPDQHHEAVAGTPYDIVESGPTAKRVMQILSQARLRFNAAAFRADIERLETDDPFRAQFAGTMAELNMLGITDEPIVTRSRFVRQRNRRFSAVDVSPQYARGRQEDWQEVVPERPTERLGGRISIGNPALGVVSSVRGRWFAFPDEVEDIEFSDNLYGYDVASSQTSILSILLGLTELERITAAGVFNDTLTETAWKNRRTLLMPGYTADDKRLRELVKATWMRTAYGSPPAWTALELRRETKDVGPGWKTPNAAVAFLKMVPDGTKATAFLRMCRLIASRVGAYEGFVFRDPLDPEILVRWNPIAHYTDTINSNGLKLVVDIPGHARVVRAERSEDQPPGTRTQARKTRHPHPAVNGAYPIDHAELRKRIAPCLIHALDAALAGHVVLALDKAGARDIISNHDSWFAQLDDDAIRTAVDSATAEWFATAFPPVYEALLEYLPAGPYRTLILDAQARWERRVAAGDIPRLALKPDLPISVLRERM